MAQELEKIRQALMDVQSQLAFQEDTVLSLNETVAAQQTEMLVLRRQLELLKQRQDEQLARHEGDEMGSPLDEKPPHY